MGPSSLRLRTLATAVVAGFGVGLLGITQAHALSPGPAGDASIRFVVGSSDRVTVRVTTARPVKTLSVKLAGSRWIRCRVAGRTAACPVPHGVSLARLGAIDVVATG